MGQHNSNVKVSARVSVQGQGCLVDGITLSYERRRSCCGRRRRRLVAAFAFPRRGWGQVSSEDTRHNTSSEAAVVSLGYLRKKDGGRAVQINCLSDGVPVFRTEVTVAELLQSLALTTRGKEATVFFSLSGGKTKEGNPHFTALFCNGRRCGDGATTPVDTPHRRHPDPGKETVDCQTKVAISSGHEEGGQEQIHEGSSAHQQMEQDEDAIFQAFDASNNSAWTCEDDENEEEENVQDDCEKKDAIFQAFDAANDSAWTCEDDEYEEDEMVENGDEMEQENEYQAEVTDSSVMDVLGYIAGVVAVLLVWYNAWQEYSH